MGRLLLTLCAALTAGPAVAENFIIIDTFETDQSAFVVDPGGGDSGNFMDGAGILQTERNMFIQASTVAPGGEVSATAASGLCNVLRTGAATQGTVFLWWDGNNNTNTQILNGLGGINLTANGQDRFRITTGTNNSTTLHFRMQVFTDDSNSSIRDFTLPAAPGTVELLYSSFLLSSGTGANFAGVGAIILRTLETSGSWIAQLDEIRATDTPVSWKDTIGIRDADNNFFLRNSNSNGAADLVFTFGVASDVPLAGDWDGDGVDTIGVYRPSTGQFFLRNSNSSGPADIAFTFGGGGAGIVPVTGDWDNNGTDTIGLYVQASGVFFLRNTNSNGTANLTFTYGGVNSNYRPLTGDWDGDGDDTVGLYVQDTAVFFLRNSNSNGPADLTFTYGGPDPNYRPLDGDWDDNGTNTVGLYNAANGVVFLRNSNSNGSADITFQYGAGGATPLTGDWDNLP